MANEKRVRANNVAGAVSTSALTTGSTTLNSAALADLPVVDSTNHAALTLFARDAASGRYLVKEIVYVTAHTASATSATIVRGQEGTSAAAWDVGATWVHSPTVRDTAAGRIVTVINTSGDVTTTSTSFVDTIGSAFDLVIPAYAGDLLKVEMSGFAKNPTNTADSLTFDAATWVSGAAVNYLSGGASLGVGAWNCNAKNSNGPIMALAGGPAPYPVVAGDIASGTVTLRLRWKVSASNTSTFYADSSRQAVWWVTNFGPQAA